MKPGHAETRTRGCRRNGTTCLLAALDVATGQVVGQTVERHRPAEFTASYVQRIRNERRRWLWKNLARFPVENMPVAFRRPSGPFLCRGRRRRIPPGGVGAGLAPQDGLDRYRLGSRQRIRGEAWSARPPVRLPGPGWMPGFSEPDHREDRSGRA